MLILAKKVTEGMQRVYRITFLFYSLKYIRLEFSRVLHPVTPPNERLIKKLDVYIHMWLEALLNDKLYGEPRPDAG